MAADREPDFDDCRLGETAGPRPVEDIAGVRAAALALAQQARWSLRLFTPDLEPLVYSSEAFHTALAAFIRRHRRARVRILVQDPTRAVRDGHRLINLIETQTTHVGARRVGPDWQNEAGAFLLVDEQGLLWRPLAEHFEGTVDFAAGPRARELRRWFDDVWEHSQPEPELRRLGL